MSDSSVERSSRPWPIRSVIEGFYGDPWTWDARAEVMRWCHERAMTHYLYAPKNDPLHRERWRELYGPEMLAGFDRLVGEATLQVGFAISPGLSIDYGSADDRAALAAKVDQLVERGVGLVALLLDDIPVRPGLGVEHADLTRWLRDHLEGRATLLLTPTEYTGTRPTAYLDALAEGVPPDVAIGWTGETVVCDEITVAQATARAESLGGRPPFVWDNYPVNDAIMADRLFLGPLRGREVGLGPVCSGYAANPMTQPRSSLPALASIAGYLRGDDPVAAWEADLGDLRTFAEACDGERPAQLVESALDAVGGLDLPSDLDALDELDEWLRAARSCGAPGLEGEAEACDGERPAQLVEAALDAVGGLDLPSDLDALDELDEWLRAARSCGAPGLEGEAEAWVEQAHAEAAVGVVAVKLLRAASDPDGPLAERRRIAERALTLAYLWPPLRRSTVTVMGPRCSFRPVLAQGPDGEWRFRAAALTDDDNAIDRLVRAALARAAALDT